MYNCSDTHSLLAMFVARNKLVERDDAVPYPSVLVGCFGILVHQPGTGVQSVLQKLCWVTEVPFHWLPTPIDKAFFVKNVM